MSQASNEIPPKPVRGTATLAKGLVVLNCVGNAENPLRLADIVRQTGIPKGTVHRLVTALTEHRFLRYDEKVQTYTLGFRLFELAHKVWQDFDLRGAADPELTRLCESAGETVRLAMLDGSEVLYIDQKEGRGELNLRYAVGTRGPAYCSGTGKAILAFLEPAKQADILRSINFEPLTFNTVDGLDNLKIQLDLAKARGYAIDDQEQADGIRAVGAPILDASGRPLAAVSITGPAYRLDMQKLHSLGRDLIEACRRIAGNAGESSFSLNTRPKPLGPDHPDVKCVLPASAFLGEGPSWSPRDQALYWVDILAPSVHRLDVSTGEDRTVRLNEMVGAVVERQSGGLAVVTQHGLKGFDFETGSMTPICDPESHLPENRFNDAKCDQAGRLWAGTMRMQADARAGGLYRFDPDGRAFLMESGIGQSNGLGFSPDGKRFYFTDSRKHTIYVYDFDLAGGQISNRRVFTRFSPDEGSPDGLTVDSEGYVWGALWDGWCVIRYDPDGKVERVINLPVPRPSSCMFGGPDYGTLYVTSARIRLTAQSLAEAPLSGSVFAIETGVKGVPEVGFAG